MKHLFAFLNLLFLAGNIFAQTYQSLDPAHPIRFLGNKIVYNGDTIHLHGYSRFLDGNLTDEQIKGYPFVFNDFKKAIEYEATDTMNIPTVLYIAPYVYWIDNPDDPETHRPDPADEKIYGKARPYGMTVTCENLHLRGLTENPENVVLASNRGQTQGADGNFTMFHFIGNDLRVSNLTMGNYCNVDLDYPLKPALNRKKRAEAIVQAQLAICEGDRIRAENCRFISRLNLNPLTTWQRSFFHRCYFECTDDALAPTGVYLGCRFKFFSSKPFAQTHGAGAVILDSDIHLVGARTTQYMVKRNSPLALVDVRFHYSPPTPQRGALDSTDIGINTKVSVSPSPPSGDLGGIQIGWIQETDIDPEHIYYQYNVTLNGKPIMLNGNTVDMTGKGVLNAYLVQLNDGEKIYNTYNLLDGDLDGFDPMNIWDDIREVEVADSEYANYSQVPTVFYFDHMTEKSIEKYGIETGQDTIYFTALVSPVRYEANRPFPDTTIKVVWSVNANSADFVKIIPDGIDCKIIPTNYTDAPREVIIYATTESGLKAAKKLTVKPPTLPAPKFIKKPEIKRIGDELILNYELDLQGKKDESEIVFSRIAPNNSKAKMDYKNATTIAKSRDNTPLKSYPLTKADAGNWIDAIIAAKSNRSGFGTIRFAKLFIPKEDQSKLSENISTDFHNFPINCTSEIRRGFWIMDKHRPQEEFTEWKNDSVCPWAYGFGFDVAANAEGLYQTARGARLLYTPVDSEYGDMSLATTLAPCKSAGQGFGSATGQYLEIYIKYDTRTQTGYGLRIVRTTRHDRAVDFVLMKYTNGKATPISEAITSTCYKGNCTVSLTVKGNRLTATAASDKSEDRVNLQAVIERNDFGGIGFQHTGTGNTNATVIKHLTVDFGK